MQPKYFVRDATGLVREFSSLDVLLFASAMVFALVFTTVQFPWFYGNTYGANLPLSLVVAAIPFVFLMLAYWVVGLVMPRTGSDYVWVSRILHPSIGFAWAMIYMVIIFLIAYAGEITSYAYAFSISLTTSGLVSNSASLTSAGAWWGGSGGTYLLALIFTGIFALFAIFGTRYIKGVIYISWIAAIVGMIVMWYILGTTSTTTFVHNWNSLIASPSAYPNANYSGLEQNGINMAQAAGAQTTATGFNGLLIALPLASLFLFGGNYVNAFAGEIKNVRKTVPIALFLSLLFGIIYWSVTSTLTLQTVGASWMQHVGYTYNNGGCSCLVTAPFPPSQPLVLAVAAYGNNALIYLMFTTYLVGSIAPLFAYFWIPSKYFFAWSFDRVIPNKFASIYERFHTPWLAIIAVVAMAIVFSIPYAFYGWASTFTVGTVIWGILYVIPGIAVTIFPFVKKDLFERSPGFVKSKIGGLPIVSLIGIATTIGFAYLGYIGLSNALYGGGAVGVFNTFTYELLIAIVVAGFVIYIASYYYHKSHGIDLSLAFKEIPPE